MWINPLIKNLNLNVLQITFWQHLCNTNCVNLYHSTQCRKSLDEYLPCSLIPLMVFIYNIQSAVTISTFLQAKSYSHGYFFLERRVFLLCNVHTEAALQGHSLRNATHPLTAVNAPSLQTPLSDIPLKDWDIYTVFPIIQHSQFHYTPITEGKNLTLCFGSDL